MRCVPAGDALGTPDVANLSLEPAWPSWFSPIGWGQQTLAFTDDNWWPVVWIASLALVAVVAALVVHARRELGASLLLERDGRESARAWLGSPFALAWRLQSASLLAWAVGSALLGVVSGSLVSAIANTNLDSPAIAAIMQSLGHTQGDLGRALIPAIMIMVGLLAAAARRAGGASHARRGGGWPARRSARRPALASRLAARRSRRSARSPSWSCCSPPV